MSTRCARDRFAAALPLVAFLALAILLGACTFPSAGCRPEELVAPSNTAPADDHVIDHLSPTLTWSYDGACEPESFRIRLSSSLEWPEGMTAEVEGTTTWWVPPTALEPAMSYSWSVQAISGSAEGPRGGGTFRTGPVCASTDPADYAAPVLMSPANGSAVELAYITFGDGTREPTVSFQFVWDDPTSCLPSEGYHVEVATSPDFRPDAIVDDWTTTHRRSMFFFPPGVEWEQCADYFWRVSTVLPDGIDGPTSETWSFLTPNATGALCAVLLGPHVPPLEVAPPVTGTSAIAGHVWHDECAVPYASTDIAPPGCIFMPGGGLEANGVLDPGEGGIEGVTVHLGVGSCPAETSWTDTTDASGYYSFTNLAAGAYCVSTDAMDDDNISVLIPGWWTSPERWYGPGPIWTEVTLGEADIHRFNDFGWDYQFLPAPSAPTPTPTSAPPMARLLMNANCRRGPGTVYDVVTSLLQGQTVPIDGRNAESTWWRVLPQGLMAGCWLAGNTVEVSGELQNVQMLTPPPTPIQACWVQNCQQCPLVCTLPCPPNATPGGPCTP